jgi:fructose-1,6-bisphosphatase II / sedoheptulose-1,7-bisphosphatase
MTIPSHIAAGALAATEAAAIAAHARVGRGDEKAADQVAVDAMRTALNAIAMKGRVVIGEGERDEAPMLYIGEEVGTGEGDAFDIALDPLEGTTLTAKAMQNALAVLAIAPRGGLLHAPDTYMDKIAVGPGLPEGVVDLDASPSDNVRALAKAKGVTPADIGVCVLDRTRHAAIIEDLRAIGARVHLITDGDVAGVIYATDPTTGIDLYLGQGGAPEGVLAAAALRCVGGQFQGRLVFRNDDERARAARTGITDLDRKYALSELVSTDVVFSATGVTNGALVQGVSRVGGGFATETLVLDSAARTARIVRTRRLG